MIFVVTSATNNCPVHAPFLAALRRYCAHRGARLRVVPIRYRNPRTPQEDEPEGQWWPREVLPDLCEVREDLASGTILFGDARLAATHKNPLAGLDAIGRGAHAIFGHPQLMLRTVPTPHLSGPRYLMTTGSVSRPIYSGSGQGLHAEFHHSLAAVLVEVDAQERVHFRQLVSDDRGSFQDLTTVYTPNGVSERRVEALVVGDEHVGFTAPAAKEAVYGPGGLVDALRPRVIVSHDVLDTWSVSHHERDDPFIAHVKHWNGRDDLREEVERAVEYLRDTTPSGVKRVVVASNHHEHVMRWLRETDWRRDPVNAPFYLELAKLALNESYLNAGGVVVPDVFAMWASAKLPSRVQFLARGQSFRVEGVELGLHGDCGPAGSIGSLQSLDRIASRFIVGHRHAPGIYRGGVQVGTLSWPRTYQRGPSDWAWACAVVYAGGKRSLIMINQEGAWRS